MSTDYQLDLYMFLQNKISTDRRPYTHMRSDSISRIYTIQKDELNKFYKIYSDVVDENNSINIIENQAETGPLVIDLDFETTENTRQYKKENITLIISKIIELYEEQDNIADNYKVIVMEKESPEYNERRLVYKDGLHIMLIAPISKNNRILILKQLQVFAEDTNLFSFQLNNVDRVVDKAVVNCGWPLYGSRKTNRQCYKITNIIKVNSGIMQQDLITNYNTFELVKLCSVRQYAKDN